MYDYINFDRFKFPEIRKIVDKEYEQIKQKIILLGSANLPFENVLRANGTVFDYNAIEKFFDNKLCFKYTTEELEKIGQKKVLRLFGIKNSEYGCTLQPYSGTQANQIIYHALLNKGDHVLALREQDGGHISHINYVNKFFNLHTYSISPDTYDLDYEEIETLCEKFSPRLLIAGTTSYPRMLSYDKLGKICKKYNIHLLADISHTALYVATQFHTAPFPYADYITFTTNKTTRGGRGAILIYRKEYEEKVLQSLSMISQGATIFSSLLSKNIMLSELLNMNIKNYQNIILKNTKIFIDIFLKYGFEIYTSGSDTHLIIIRNIKMRSDMLQKALYNSGILLNVYHTDENISSIRIGTLFISTLQYSAEDVSKIVEYIAQIILYNRNYYKECKKIAEKYTSNIFK